jgi:hypothetical protein
VTDLKGVLINLDSGSYAGCSVLGPTFSKLARSVDLRIAYKIAFEIVSSEIPACRYGPIGQVIEARIGRGVQVAISTKGTRARFALCSSHPRIIVVTSRAARRVPLPTQSISPAYGKVNPIHIVQDALAEQSIPVVASRDWQTRLPRMVPALVQ